MYGPGVDFQAQQLVPGERVCNSLLLFGETPLLTESLSLAEVASKLGRETLQRLKRECGGLQTLLRNNHQVFEGKGLSLTWACFSDTRRHALPRLRQQELLTSLFPSPTFHFP